MIGPRSTDFDLYLERYDDKTESWKKVKAKATPRRKEQVTYKVKKTGVYQWTIMSYSGKGDYRFEMNMR